MFTLTDSNGRTVTDVSPADVIDRLPARQPGTDYRFIDPWPTSGRTSVNWAPAMTLIRALLNGDDVDYGQALVLLRSYGSTDPHAASVDEIVDMIAELRAWKGMPVRDTPPVIVESPTPELITERAVQAAIAAERLRLAKVAARIAQANSYCNEYDRIAAATGLPTRDELRENGDLTTTYDVTVRTRLDVVLTVTVTTDGHEPGYDDVDSDSVRDRLDELIEGDYTIVDHAYEIIESEEYDGDN
jgi:hypothetical protein